MRDYLGILDRAYDGEYISEENWDLEKVAASARRLVRKYRLEWDRNQLIPTDDALIDAVFQAGLEMAIELGVYCRSTERIIRLTLDEIEESLRAMPQTLVMGEGKDARTLYARRIGDERAPLFFGGSPGSPIPEEYFLENVISYVQEPLIDLATCGTLTAIAGREVRTGQPLEIVATRRELQLLHTALARVGRPGMGMLAAQSSVSELGDLAVAQPNLLRRCDSHLVPLLNELKLDFRNMARAVNSWEYGMINASLPCVIVGGLGGGPPGSAVINVASFIVSNVVCLADYHILHPIHIRHVATTTREVLWVISAVGQAFARNAPAIIVADIYPKSGAGTIELLYETAANAIVNSVSACHLEGCGSADGKLPNCSGLEARWMAEVALAAYRKKMTREEANQWVLRLLERYEKVFAQEGGNPGKPFDQVYNLKTLRPTPEWQAMYDQVKTELKVEGLI
ncbi:MAG: monomethylamine:corrinoid methyltransferase [Anaerolineales bacterium]|nr:monomethylamine:corrinoid methyltransferase [Anaerolineales bacterium]MDW8446029.1 monomethylamine:corrinoid methyltransferase [Anaerolineales bacterium]